MLLEPFARLSDIGDSLAMPSSVQEQLKQVMLNNPAVQYPFVLNASNQFLFPIQRKGTPVLPKMKLPPIRDTRVAFLFNEGEILEFRMQKISTALRRYVDSLQLNTDNRLQPYLLNAVARCYFKLGRMQQAISYYRDILAGYSTPPHGDLTLYIAVLRQCSLCYKYLGENDRAVKIVLKLYEGVLQAEHSENPQDFTFFKNEALDFLNRHIPSTSQEKKRLRNAKTRDHTQDLSRLDMALQWRYFDFDQMNAINTGGKNDYANALRFQKIQEFYLANDAKTQFYKTMKQKNWWYQKPAQGIRIFQIKIPTFTDPVNVVLGSLNSHSLTNKTETLVFGFMISATSLDSPPVKECYKLATGTSDLKIGVIHLNRPQPKLPESGGFNYPLVTVPFEHFFNDRGLALFARARDFVKRETGKEIRFNYVLIAGFILVLLLGILLLYKYLVRESELIRLKSEFTDRASHTLKTPLTRIRMLVEKLQLGWVADENKKSDYFNTILSETDRMNDMITNMLDYSRIENGKKQYRFEPVSLSTLVDEAISSYRAYIRGMDVQLDVEVDKACPTMHMDPAAISLIIINLLQNAVKYSTQTKRISVGLYQEVHTDPSVGAVVLEVRDQGIGIASRELNKVFHRFYRAADERIQAIEGSGLGLYLVQHAVDAHQGHIHVDSSLGNGTTFKIYFPTSFAGKNNE